MKPDLVFKTSKLDINDHGDMIAGVDDEEYRENSVFDPFGDPKIEEFDEELVADEGISQDELWDLQDDYYRPDSEYLPPEYNNREYENSYGENQGEFDPAEGEL